jgi:hypothetical protein
MKALGIILIVIGLGMFIFHGFTYTKKENVANIGPVEINTNEDKTVSWPYYAGGIAILAGIGVLAIDRKS